MPATTPEAGPGQIVRANGTDIYYREHGRGRPLVLLHGGTLSGDSWEPYLAGFAEHYRVIVPDTPGIKAYVERVSSRPAAVRAAALDAELAAARNTA